MPTTNIIAADVGNARIKLGLFAADCTAGLPEPVRTLPLLGDEPELDKIEAWLPSDECMRHTPCAAPLAAHGVCGIQWWLASVNRPAATRLIDWLKEHRPADRVTLLAAGDLPLQVRLERPDMVGIDRLVDALAVNRLRDAGRPAVIVDVGSAITVDLVSPDGAFLGGAILPGIQMAARAMHEFTDLLPLVDTSELSEPPPALGTATIPAMQSGLFWGTVGAIRQLIEQLAHVSHHARDVSNGVPLLGTSSAKHNPAAQHCLCQAVAHRGDEGRPDDTAIGDAPPQVFLTGGAGAVVAELLGPDARYVLNLTLSGIALATKTKGLGIRN